MMFRMILVCALVGAGSALSCRWMEHKYRDYRDNSLGLLNAMVNNSISSINSTEDADLEDAVAFPNELYNVASKAIVSRQMIHYKQMMMDYLHFRQRRGSDSWHTDGLRSCVASQSLKRKNRKLSMYFKRLSTLLEQMSHSAEAWEWIHTEVKLHLQRADLLIAAKTN
uniref:Uncharacterized protein n=1 Tax=Periophthalmus magnuspinnatus TaxID=409849 RepID=A0A3B4AMM9_9GOBI